MVNSIRYYISKLFRCIPLVALVVCVSCNDEYNSSNAYAPLLSIHYLKPSNCNFSFESNKSSEILHLTCEGAEWEIINNAKWLNISPSSGNTTTDVTISADEHLSGDTARISIMSLVSVLPDWDYNRVLSVSQAAAIPYLNPSINTCNFPGTAYTKEIHISSNSLWSVECDSEWLQATKVSEDVLSISVIENPTNEFRKANVFLSNKSGEHIIEVTQYAAGVSISQTSIQTDKGSSLFTLKIESEIAWTATTSADWIQVSPNQGNSGASILEISTTENNSTDMRKGYVYIYTEEYQKAQIEIVQKGIYINVIDKQLVFSSEKETKQISIQSNTEWNIKEIPAWLSASVTCGEGDFELEITSEENLSTTLRSGTIIIAHEFLNLSFEVIVTQESKTFDIDNKTLEFGIKAATQPINLVSGLPWQSTVSDDWISTDISHGNGNATVLVSVTETMSYDERFGHIKYNVVDKDIFVNVHQLAKYFTLDDRSFSFGSTGGTALLSFTSNETWTIQMEDSVDWITLSQSSGEGNANISVSVADNPSVNDRSSCIVINTSVGQSIKIPITQSARYLKVDATAFTYFAKGGEDMIKISTDGTFKVETSDDWIRAEEVSANVWKLSIEKNILGIIRNGTVTIQLTDLIDGEFVIQIPVTQTYEGGIYIDRGFKEEVAWDVTSDDKLSVSIVSYAVDNTWDSTKEDNVVISREEYQHDDEYDSSKKDNVGVNKDNYDNDKEYDSSKGDSLELNKNKYGDETGYDSSQKDSIEVNKDGYHNDDYYDSSKKDTANINRKDYGKDKEWD